MQVEHNGIVFTFHRGFCHEVTCSWSDWRRHADAIRAATPLKRVRLTTWPPPNLEKVRDLGFDASRAIELIPYQARVLLEASYPGIEFELPREPAFDLERFEASRRQAMESAAVRFEQIVYGEELPPRTVANGMPIQWVSQMRLGPDS